MADVPAGGRPPRSLWLDVAILAVGLVALLALSERSTGFSVDEGSYAIQAHALRDGSWAISWPFRAVDAAATHFPYHGGSVSPVDEFAYVSHPTWPAVLSIVTRAVPEEVGLRLLSLGAVAAAALAGAGIARRLAGPSAARWGFWIVATSPVLPDGLMVWAHAPAAALAGGAVLAALALSRQEAGWWWAVLVGAVAGGVLVRSESLLFGLALAGAVGAAGLWQRERRLIGVGLVAGASAGVALVGERLWIRHILGTGGLGIAARDDGSGAGWLSGHVHGAGQALLAAALSPRASACSFAGLVLVVLVVVARRRPDLLRVPPAALLAGAVLVTLARLALAGADPVSGLLVAWPVVALAALAIRRGSGTEQVLVLGSALFGLAVLATQYEDGGGLQWGGRYLAPLVVPLAALAAVGLVTHLASGRERQAVALLLAATALLGVLVTDHIRRTSAHQLRAMAALDQSVVVVDNDQAARLDWHAWPDRCWIDAAGDVRGTVGLLEASGVTDAAYLGFSADAFAQSGAVARPVSRTAGALHLPGTVANKRSPCAASR